MSPPSVGEATHLVQRFFSSLIPVGPPAEAKVWAHNYLVPGEQVLFEQMSGPDQRHHIAVAQRTLTSLPDAERWVMAAALLHDVGKVRSGLGTIARALVTVLALLVGRDRLLASDHLKVPHGPFASAALYLRHPEIGSSLITAAGGDDRSAAWALEHHQPPDMWTVPLVAGQALKAADDD